uniref:Uridylate kinase n=1 Tax=Blastobotrys adeninivorans TaxID=409370 RepID=A0A060T2Q3_BLAAD
MLARTIGRQLKGSGRIVGLSAPFSPLARPSLVKGNVNQLRFNSQFKMSKEQLEDEQVKKRSAKLLFLLLTLAIGSTLIARNTKKSREVPRESIEDIVDENEMKRSSAPASAVAKKDISVIFVLGGPGSGKGTQSANLVKDYGFVHLSAGDLLREEQARPGSQYGQLIDEYIRAGKIVPQEVTIGLLERAISENMANGKTKFLVDGFPRKMDQAITFEEKVAKSDFTLFFECPESVMLERLLSRGQTSGRADDNVESIKKRFRVFVETSMPVVDYFDKQGRVVKLQCDKSPDQVYSTVKDALKQRGVIE